MADEGERIRRLRWFALAGIVGPILFSIVVVILAALETDYSHVVNTVSTLGDPTRSSATAMGVNFVVFGTLLVIFAYGLHRGIAAGSRVGPALVGTFGVGIGLAGVFPCGPCTEFSNFTYENMTHGLVAGLAFISFMVAPFVLSRRVREDDRWADLERPLLILGVAIVVLNVAFWGLAESGYGGAAQRVLVAAIFVCLELLAIRQYKIADGWAHNSRVP